MAATVAAFYAPLATSRWDADQSLNIVQQLPLRSTESCMLHFATLTSASASHHVDLILLQMSCTGNASSYQKEARPYAANYAMQCC